MKYADHKSLQKYNIPIPSPEEEKTIFQLMAAAFYALTGYEGYIDLVDVVDGYTPVYKKDTNGKYVTDKNNNLVREHNGYLHTGAFLNGWYEHCPLDK